MFCLLQNKNSHFKNFNCLYFIISNQKRKQNSVINEYVDLSDLEGFRQFLTLY